MNDIKTAKTKLQDDLLDLIAKFEKEWGVGVAELILRKERILGDEVPYTSAIVIRVLV